MKLGQEFDWWAGPPDKKKWHHHGKILEIVNQKRLSYTWEYPGYTGKSIIIWELFTLEKNTTKLNFTHEFIEPFDPKEESLKRENFLFGWDYILHTSLKEYLDKNN